MTTYSEIRQQTIDALESGDPDSAFQTLRTALSFGHGVLEPASPDFGDAFQVFARLSEHFAPPDFVQLIQSVADAPNDIQALYNLGYALYEEGLFAIGATVLARAESQAPGEPAIVSEFVCTLENCGMNQYAVEVLQRYPDMTQQSFMHAYLLAFNQIMSGNPADARTAALVLTDLSDGSSDQLAMQSRIQAFLSRAESVADCSALDHHDLRGWHYVLTGGLLTSLSPYGYPDPMNGRFAMLQERYGTIRAGIDNLERIIRRTGYHVLQVAGFPDRSSQVVATAVANRLAVSLVPLTRESCQPGTVAVAWDLSAIDDLSPYEALFERNGEVLYSHCMNWVDMYPIAPDVVTLLHQMNTPPWEAQLRADPKTDSPGYTDPDTRSVDELAVEILAAEPDTEEGGEVPPLTDEFLDRVGQFGAGGFRERMWNSSPVSSSRFI